MVVGINSTPTGIPNLEFSEEGNFIESKHLNRDTAQLQNSMALK